jgi:hypothetical protein
MSGGIVCLDRFSELSEKGSVYRSTFDSFDPPFEA